MIRVGDLALFALVKAGNAAAFASPRQRTVRFTVNCPVRTALTVVPMNDDGSFAETEPMFLCMAEGLEDVEFFARGPFALEAEADFYLKTVDGTAVHTVVPDAVTFTRIAERRVRDPQIEHMQHVLMKNMERRMGALAEERKQESARIENALKAINSRAGASGGNSPAPEPAAGAGQSVPSPAAAAGAEKAPAGAA